MAPCGDIRLPLFQAAQRKGVTRQSPLSPEVLSVFVPPFVSKEESTTATGASCASLGRGRRRSFRKRREKPRAEPGRGPMVEPGAPTEPEDVSIPGGVDLLALPQLCFPGASVRARGAQLAHPGPSRSAWLRGP